jgi:GT2 family glycosyltransferase
VSKRACDVSLIVLNWNGADLLRRHLPAVLEAARRAPVATQVWVIDNASHDGSRDVVRSFEGAQLIAMDANRKLHAYNDAASMVDCEAFMMLNNDVSPAADLVGPMYETLSADPSIFAVAGEVVETATGRLDSGPTAARWRHGWALEPEALGGASEPVNVAYVSGGAGLYRRNMFLALGGFWELLPGLYWEDVELGLRAWMHGWRSVFDPRARFDHESGVTVRRHVNPYLRELRTYQNIRLTHWALLLDRRDLRDYLANELRRSLTRPHYFAAYLTMARFMPGVLRRRRELKARCAVVSAAELQARWSPGMAGRSGAQR